MTKPPWRPPLRYMGGKWRAARHIIPLLRPHRTYVEPFGGAASILLQKPRSYGEIYNDLDSGVVNLFRVLRDPEKSATLIRGILLTPFAREEFEASVDHALEGDEVERARMVIARSFMGHGSTGLGPLKRRTGFRRDSTMAAKHQAKNWAQLPAALEAVVERLRGVVIENIEAVELIARVEEQESVLIYVDPPYLPSVRTRRMAQGKLEHSYNCDMTQADHVELLERLVRSKSMIVLSGYGSELYDEALGAWQRYEFDASAEGGRQRREVVWLNPGAHAAHGVLFG